MLLSFPTSTLHVSPITSLLKSLENIKIWKYFTSVSTLKILFYFNLVGGIRVANGNLLSPEKFLENE
jgi:hypothetical protein